MPFRIAKRRRKKRGPYSSLLCTPRLRPRRCAGTGLEEALALRKAVGEPRGEASTLARRLHLSDEQFAAARQQLIDLDLIAYRSPLYQVLALPGTVAAPRPVPRAPAITGATTGGQPVSLATLLQQAQARRG